MVAGCLLLAAGVAAAADPSPLPFQVVKARYRSSEGVLLDRDGVPLQQLRLDFSARRFDWTPLEAMAPAMIEAVVASEDKRFFEHSGVDWTAFGAAAVQNLLSGKTRGASTISMQVAAMLEPGRLGRGGYRTVGQKWSQAQAARDLEANWTKRQILEAYLNLTVFRSEYHGIAAAAQALFGKPPSALERGEAMLLAVLLRGTNAPVDKVAQRACALAQTMPNSPSCSELQRLAKTSLTGPSNLRYSYDLAPHVARQLVTMAGTSVRSSLRADLQRFALDTLQKHLREHSSRNVEEAALVILDNASGEVLAYAVASIDAGRAATVDSARVSRPAGATLLPFLYGVALEHEWLTAASLLDDTPVDLVSPTGAPLPTVADREFRGWTSVRTALGSSLSVPAVRVLLLTSPETFHQRLKALGFDSLPKDAETYGYSLGLGNGDATLLALTDAYRTLANHGLRREPRFVPLPEPTPIATPGPTAAATTGRRLDRLAPPATRVMAAGAAFIVGDILADPGARTYAATGTLLPAARGFVAATASVGKDRRDSWCVGFTDRYTVGVWIGNFTGTAIVDAAGAAGAAPVWRETVEHLHRDRPSRNPTPPAGVVRAEVAFVEELESARGEWFVKGTELALSGPLWPEESAAQPKIAFPHNGAVLALDADPVRDRQRLPLRMRPQKAGATWWIGSEVLGSGLAAHWPLERGRHTIELKDGDGTVLDTVAVEVR